MPFAVGFEEARQLPLYARRAMAAISNTSGVLALVLTIVGLYGVIAYGVSQRLREFAVRMALDARPSDILGGVVSRGRLDGTTVTGSLPVARSKTSN